MIKTGCEVICMTWDFHEILSVGILKNVIPNLEIKFVDEFSENPRTWKIESYEDLQFGYYLTYCDICSAYQIDDGDRYAFLSNTIVNNNLMNIINELKPKTSVMGIWEEAFLYAVEIASAYTKAKNFNLFIYHSCYSWFENAKDGYVLIEDENSPWEEIVINHPDIKFAIIDMSNSYDYEKPKMITDGVNVNPVHYINLRYKVKPIVVDRSYRIPVFSNRSKMMLTGYPNTEIYSVMEPDSSWESWTRVDEVSFERLNDAIDFVKDMISKYNKRNTKEEE